MPNKKFSALLLLAVGIFLVASMFIFWPTTDASAQCGSQASSCKNCHEVQAKDPVNNDGTGWHQSHAFGDFCYLCHAGNAQSMNIDEAHAGMVPPLSDVNASCQACHPADLDAMAQVYATALGVEVGAGGTSSGPSGDATGASTGSTTGSTAASAPLAAGVMVVDTSNVAGLVDYNQVYNETVLGQRTINWGNWILGGLIAMVLVGGGSFIYTNERKLRGLPAGLPALSKSQPQAVTSPVNPADYPQEILAFLPHIAQLNPVGQHALQRLLQEPDQASELLYSLSRLDPELVQKLRGLNRESRALLLALSAE
jgi:hypothetical protein